MRSDLTVNGYNEPNKLSLFLTATIPSHKDNETAFILEIVFSFVLAFISAIISCLKILV